MKIIKKIVFMLAIVCLSQTLFSSFAADKLVININSSKTIPMKGSCKVVNNNCSYPIFVPLYPSGATKSFFLNTPSCVTVSNCDLEPPTTIDNANNVRRNTDFPVTLTSNETGTTAYCVDTTATCTPNIIGTNVTVSCAIGTTCSSQYVRYHTIDIAGNVEQIRTSAQIRIDKQAPTGGTFTINNNASATNTTSVTLTTTCATDAGVGGVQVAFGNSANPTNWTSCSSSISHTLSAGDGVKTVYMRFRDSLGNTTTDVTDTITLDTVIPVITINNPTTTPAQSKTITASTNEGTLTMTTGSTSTTCNASRTFIAYASTTFSSEADNGKYVCYRAIDTAGNTRYALSNAIAGIDTTGPTGTISINGGASSTTNPTVTLTLSASDINGVSQMQFSCNNNNRTTPETYATTKTFNITNQAGAGCTTTAGTKTVYVKYKDNLGNWGTTISNTIVYAVCGNGIVEIGETCDGGSQSCSLGGVAGSQGCNSSCNGWYSCVINPCKPSYNYTQAGGCYGLWTMSDVQTRYCAINGGTRSDTIWNCNYGGNTEICYSVVSDGLECSGGGGGGGGGGGCFIEGTKVLLTDGILVPIETIITGDIVLGMNNSQNAVVKLYKLPSKSWKLYAINNSDYFVTDTHPFMTLQGWKSFNPQGTIKENPGMIISQLQIGDILITRNGTITIYSIDFKERSGYVYNFKLDGNQTYYADGYLVHNPVYKVDPQN